MAVEGVTTTSATPAGVTVSCAFPVRSSLLAVIVTEPGRKVVTTPSSLTIAIAVFELLQMISRPFSTIPFAARSTAVACDVSPSTTDDGVSVTLTLETATEVTVRVAVPLEPVMVVVPAASVVIPPVDAFTVAIAGSELCQLTTRLPRTFPLASRNTALAVDD